MANNRAKLDPAVQRIVHVVFVFQILGGIVGILVGFHFFWFYNLWLGGVVATLPGIVVGFVHASRRESERRNEWIGQAYSLGLFGICFVVLGVGSILPIMTGHMRHLAGLKDFHTEVVRSIDVFDEDAINRIVTINHPETLAQFARAISDAEGHMPSHPRYSDSWYVVVEASRKYEFELHIDPDLPDSVVGYFVERTGNHLRNFGSFASRGLRPWIDAHLR